MTGRTAILVELILEALAGGAGNLDPQLDDLKIEYRRATGCTLDQARRAVAARLNDALWTLAERDRWIGVRVTEHYLTAYAHQLDDHPSTDEELRRCVAGTGGSAATRAIHFCTRRSDCLMAIWSMVHSGTVERGVRERNVGRLTVAAENGQLSPEAVDRITTASGVVPGRDLRRVRRIAAGATLLPSGR